MRVQLPQKFSSIFEPHRYKVYYGGRGSGKSWSVATALLILSCTKKITILCTREIQRSLSDSVYRLLVDTIDRLGLTKDFNITKTEITSLITGSRFIFMGLYRNQTKLKSLEGVDICWVEEAESVSQQSWDILLPTIRKDDSEIWVTFNPDLPDDPVYQMFLVNNRPDSLVIRVNHEDNPYFPAPLRKEMEYDQEFNADRYLHIWCGHVRESSDAQIFRESYIIKDFTSPAKTDWVVGMDFGFSQDPTALIRGFLSDNILFLDKEIYAYGATYEELPSLIDDVIPSKGWPITADSARPDTIDYLKRRGYRITGAKKGKNSIIDGIERIKGFKTVVIHPSLKNTIEEFKLYSYKVNPHTDEILPDPSDRNNHIIDSLRYATEAINPRAAFISWDDL